MNRIASVIAMRRWPPLVLVALMEPSSTQRLTEDSLTPMA
jgi:hypothetical protein